MNRPTCETCAYWYRNSLTKDSCIGACQRRPPDPCELPIKTATDDWCGEHHLFPAYLKSLERSDTEESTPAPPAGN